MAPIKPVPAFNTWYVIVLVLLGVFVVGYLTGLMAGQQEG